MAFKFNYLRVFTQDYLLGKVLSMVISLAEMAFLLATRPSRRLLRLFGFIFKIKPHYSMLSTLRLLNLYQLAQEAEQMGLTGDVVECGVWNGGAASMIARGIADSKSSIKRTIWLFDSFEGLPPPGNKDKKSEVECYFKGLCKGAIENVHDIFGKMGVSMSNVKIVKGWLDTTLKVEIPKEIVLLHVDTDWYNSVKAPLDYLYNRVVPGGFIIVDDYWFHEGCKAAVGDFIKEQNLTGKIQLVKIDRSAVYFRKPFETANAANPASAAPAPAQKEAKVSA